MKSHPSRPDFGFSAGASSASSALTALGVGRREIAQALEIADGAGVIAQALAEHRAVIAGVPVVRRGGEELVELDCQQLRSEPARWARSQVVKRGDVVAVGLGLARPSRRPLRRPRGCARRGGPRRCRRARTPTALAARAAALASSRGRWARPRVWGRGLRPVEGDDLDGDAARVVRGPLGAEALQRLADGGVGLLRGRRPGLLGARLQPRRQRGLVVAVLFHRLRRIFLRLRRRRRRQDRPARGCRRAARSRRALAVAGRVGRGGALPVRRRLAARAPRPATIAARRRTSPRPPAGRSRRGRAGG